MAEISKKLDERPEYLSAFNGYSLKIRMGQDTDIKSDTSTAFGFEKEDLGSLVDSRNKNI